MFYVYFIKSINSDFNYIGVTSDLKRRFFEHNAGGNLSTKAYSPFKLVYYEAYASRKDADKRERNLKHHGSTSGHLKKRIENSLKI